MPNIQSYNTPNQYVSYNPNTAGNQNCVLNGKCLLKVNGNGKVNAVPDRAIAVLGVTTENMQLEAAQRENAERTAAVINSIVSLGIPKEDIQTQTYQIQPQYDFVDGRQVFRGYRVVHNLRVVINNIAMVGRIIDSAVAAGANTVNGIDFTVSDPSRYYREALNLAVSDAITKAAAIGMRLKVNIYPVPVRVIEKLEPVGVPIPLMSIQAAAPTTPVQPGQIEIAANIEAIFTYA